jgi:hypothetical protein
MDPPRKVAVSGKYGNLNPALFKGAQSRIRQGARVPDAGRATISNDAKANGLKVLQQARALQ